MKHLPDLRAFVAELDSIGEITHVGKEVDWNLELGAVARRSYELRAPAPLFENITGIENGFRVLAAPGGLSAQPGLTYARLAVAPGGVRGDNQDMHPPGTDLRHEEHVQTLEEHGVNMQEVTRQDPGCL